MDDDYAAVRKAFDYVQKKNADFLREAKKILKEPLSGMNAPQINGQKQSKAKKILKEPLSGGKTRRDAGDAAQRLDALLADQKLGKYRKPEVAEAANAARALLEELAANGDPQAALDEADAKRIVEALNDLKASGRENPDLDLVCERVREATGEGIWVPRDCKPHYDRIIEQKRNAKKEPMRKEDKKPTLAEVKKAILELQALDREFVEKVKACMDELGDSPSRQEVKDAAARLQEPIDDVKKDKRKTADPANLRAVEAAKNALKKESDEAADGSSGPKLTATELKAVQRVKKKLEKLHVGLPSATRVFKLTGGDMGTLLDHYHAIEEELKKAAGSDEVAKLVKDIEDWNTMIREAESEKEAREAELAGRLVSASRKVLMTSFMLPGQATAEAKIAALRKRIAELRARRDEAQRLLEKLLAE